MTLKEVLIDVPFLDHSQKPPKVQWIKWGFLLGQDLLHNLWVHNREEFSRRFWGGDAANVRHFWEMHKDNDPRILNHPMTEKDDWMDKTIPGKIHGDVAPYGKGRLAGLNAISWSSKLAKGEALDCINLWTGIPKKYICTASLHGVDSHKTAWRVLVWDALCMLRGQRLSYDWNGKTWDLSSHPERGALDKDIAGGYRVGMLQIGIDGEYAANHLKLKHWRNRWPCNRCPCDQGQYSRMPMNDFREDSAWKRRLVTMEEWLQNMPDHPLWTHRLGLTIFSYCVDIMHAVHKGAKWCKRTCTPEKAHWYARTHTPEKAHAPAARPRKHAHMCPEGVVSYFAPSAIWTLVHDCGLEGTFQQRGEYVYAELVVAWKARGVEHKKRLPREEFFACFGNQTGPTPGAYPECHGKASHLQHLVPALFDVCSKVNAERGLTAPEHEHRLEGLRLLMQFDEIVTQNGEVLADDVARDLLEKVDTFCLRQNFLELVAHAYGTGRGRGRTRGLRKACQHARPAKGPSARARMHMHVWHHEERHYAALDRPLYNITLKTHNVWHMAEQAWWYNPRGGWCYAEERFMGLVARACAGTTKGGLYGIGKSFPKRCSRASARACTIARFMI